LLSGRDQGERETAKYALVETAEVVTDDQTAFVMCARLGLSVNTLNDFLIQLVQQGRLESMLVLSFLDGLRRNRPAATTPPRRQ